MPTGRDITSGKRNSSGKKNANCSFCRKSYREVGPLVEGPDNAYICGECIEVCQSILEQEHRRRGTTKKLFKNVPTPREIVTHLNDYVIGQERAKKVMAVAVHNHYKRLMHAEEASSDVELDKSNILLIGPTGCGKTRFVAHMAAKLGRKLYTVACHDDLAAADLIGRYLLKGGETVWVDRDWRGVDADGNTIEPKSRTFIPALLSDNPYLGADYRARVAAMPEPLRSQLLYGDFNVAEKDQVNQVIPTAWLRAAQDRWTEDGHLRPMISVGADIAQGGDDKTSLAPRHIGDHVGELTTEPGLKTPDGPTASALIVAMLRNGAQVNIDMGGGFGQSTHDHLKHAGIPVLGFIPAASPTRMPPVPREILQDPNRHDLPPPSGDSAQLKYANMRAQAWWEFRLRLDPANNPTVALPPDEDLITELAAPVWKLTPSGIVIEPKEHIRARIGRSTDKADAVIMAFVEPKDDIAAEARHFPRAVRQAARDAGGDVFDPLGDW